MSAEIMIPPLAVGKDLKTPLPTFSNCELVLAEFGERLRFEEFAGVIVCNGLDVLGPHFPDGEWTDEHTSRLVGVLDREGLHVSFAMLDRAVSAHARARSYNVLTDLLTDWALQWDGVERVDQFLATYWRAADTDATRACSRVFLLSLAARGLTPGAKVDTCPVFVGKQGTRKSTALELLVGEAFFSDSPLPIGDKDGMQNLAGTWLQEFSENESLSRKERNAVKGFLSSRRDKFRASYGHHTRKVPRQTCFAASTNDADTLNDPTGARRFMPVTVGVIDVASIARDREQLLGEAAYRVIHGEQHWPTPAEDAALDSVRKNHQESDVWEEHIAEWLDKQEEGFTFLLADLLVQALGLDLKHADKSSQGRAANALRRLGWERGPQNREDEGTRQRRWRKAVTAVTSST